MGTYVWTKHSRFKMRQYAVSDQMVRRVMRYPDRVEAGIVPNMVAAMRIAGSAKRRQEIWVMYEMKKSVGAGKVLHIVSVWRYPGTSPKRDPIPIEIVRELRFIVG